MQELRRRAPSIPPAVPAARQDAGAPSARGGFGVPALLQLPGQFILEVFLLQHIAERDSDR